MQLNEGRLTGLSHLQLHSKTHYGRKDRRDGKGEEAHIRSYGLTLRKRQDTGNGKSKHKVAVSGELGRGYKSIVRKIKS
jgi:hypothetical protein